MNLVYEKELGLNIRTLRKKRNFTQEQLSARLQLLGCDITRSSLAKIEAGQRHIYPDELKSLTQALKITYNELFV